MSESPPGDVAKFLELIRLPHAIERGHAADQQADNANPHDPAENQPRPREDVKLLLALQVFDGNGQHQLEKERAAHDQRRTHNVQPAAEGIDDVVEPIGHYGLPAVAVAESEIAR